MATRPDTERHTSGLAVVLAFAGAIAVAAALVVVAVVFRNDSPSAVDTPVVALAGIPQSNTALGSPNAEVTLIEFADLQCPACRNYTLELFPTLVRDYVVPGKVKTEFRGLTFIGPDSERALRLVLAAGLQDRLWQLQEALYRHQGRENSGWVTDDLLRELAAEIPGLEVEQALADADSARVSAEIDDSAREARDLNVRGTPTLFIQTGDSLPYPVAVTLDPATLAAALDEALAR